MCVTDVCVCERVTEVCVSVLLKCVSVCVCVCVSVLLKCV